MDRVAFNGWVSATHGRWIPVNARYLHERDVKVSQQQMRTLYVTPWVEGTGAAMVVSDDNALVTVIDYVERRYEVRPPPESPTDADGTVLSPLAKAMIRAIGDGRMTAGRSLERAMAGTLGVPPEGPAATEAMEAYAAGRIDFDGLVMVMRANHARREQVFYNLLNGPDVSYRKSMKW